ncbi:MAG: hypothetical protein ABI597_02250 [Gammaproteobacteria bacterium]
MPYVTREDGERFIIPSYRDVLSAKKPALLKKEVLLLSTNYGEYIALQRKNIDQYEAAFSPDSGYLLGESVWHNFKRPRDLIYCEAIPNTTEAILVIVKSGSVYLDGSFSVDSIPDELVVFRTQQNNFEIYIHGDVPISQTPEEGKFSLEAGSVKSFTVLPEPVFPTLPTVKAFQLRLVDAVLKSQGIGVVPLKKIIAVLVIMGLIWALFTYVTTHKKQLPKAFAGVINPYQLYVNTLMSPSPTEEVEAMVAKMAELYSVPGWTPVMVQYSGGSLVANMQSSGIRTNVLFAWANTHQAKLQITSDGVYVNIPVMTNVRDEPTTISPLQQVIAEVIDRMSYVIPGNSITLSPSQDRGRFSDAQLNITFSRITLSTLNLIAEQLKGLPLVLTKVAITVDKGNLSGAITLKALGN